MLSPHTDTDLEASLLCKKVAVFKFYFQFKTLQNHVAMLLHDQSKTLASLHFIFQLSKFSSVFENNILQHALFHEFTAT